MAIKKTIETNKGVNAEYHNIEKVIFGKTEISFTVNNYFNETARTTEKGTLQDKNLTFQLTQEQRDLLFNLVYGLVKTLPEFENAEDC